LQGRDLRSEPEALRSDYAALFFDRMQLVCGQALDRFDEAVCPVNLQVSVLILAEAEVDPAVVDGVEA
jgi:hypothetical protein